MNAIDQKVVITYPVQWSYRLVGKDHEAIQQTIARVMQAREHKVSLSNTSSTGKFVSYSCELLIMNDEERLFFYEEFKRQEAVLYLL